MGRDVPQRPDEDGQTCEDHDDTLMWSDRAASLLKTWKILFLLHNLCFCVSLSWISLTEQHCKSQRWALAKLMLIKETVVIQESWECIPGSWASHDRGRSQLIWPSLCLQTWREEGFAACSYSWMKSRNSMLEDLFLITKVASDSGAPHRSDAWELIPTRLVWGFLLSANPPFLLCTCPKHLCQHHLQKVWPVPLMGIV